MWYDMMMIWIRYDDGDDIMIWWWWHVKKIIWWRWWYGADITMLWWYDNYYMVIWWYDMGDEIGWWYDGVSEMMLVWHQTVWWSYYDYTIDDIYISIIWLGWIYYDAIIMMGRKQQQHTATTKGMSNWKVPDCQKLTVSRNSNCCWSE